MATIYQLTDDILFIQKMIEEGVPEEAFAEALAKFDGELTAKLEGYAMVIKNIESDIEGLKAEEERLAKRRKSLEGSVKRMKEAIHNALLTVEDKRVKTSKFTFYIQSNPPSMVLDENLIPQEFKSTNEVTVIDKKAIEEKLKNGEVVEGAKFTQGESIRIR